MTLQKREKILAVVTGVLLVWLASRFLPGGAWLGGGLRAERNRLAAEIEKKEARIERAQRAAAQMAIWQQRALPADHKLAGSLYQNWLLKLSDRVGFRRTRVEPGQARTVGSAYCLLPFTIRAQASTDAILQFLFEFYSAGHLHQIRYTSVKPQEDQKTLDLMFNIEAVSLASADRAEELTALPGDRLGAGKLEEYKKVIGNRGLFTPHRPPVVESKPKETRPSEPPKFDATRFIYLTAITEAGGRLQAWLVSRTDDKTFRLAEGDPIAVGPVQGKVLRVGPREMEFEADGRRHVITLGANLSQAINGAAAGPDAPPPEKRDPPKP